MTNIDTRTLEASVEGLIQQQVAAYETALREALGRKLRSADRSRGSTRRSRKSERPQNAVGRRSAAELDALAEQFMKAVEASPGETMLTLSKQLGVGARELHRPVSKLRAASRVRMVGERSQARYFPLPACAA